MAKPILILAVIDMVDDGLLNVNKIPFNEELEMRYYTLMKRYVKGNQFENPTKVEYPFWHLQSDGFWHLKGVNPENMAKSASRSFLKDQVPYAFLDEELWILLQNPVMRLKLRDYIIEHKLPDNGKGKWMEFISCFLALAV